MLGNDGMIHRSSPWYTDGEVVRLRNPDLSIATDELYALSTDDATLSGTPVIIRLQAPNGDYYYTKAYPTASATANATIDDIGTDVRGIADAILSGAPKVFEVISGATKHYVKGYPTISAESASSRGITIRAVMFSDTTLSGTPRVATVEIGGTDHYFKAYPTKS